MATEIKFRRVRVNQQGNRINFGVTRAEINFVEPVQPPGHFAQINFGGGLPPQQLIEVFGFDSSVFGEPTLPFPQTIEPESAFDGELGLPALVFTQYIDAAGFDTALYGVPTVYYPLVLEPPGEDQALYGEPSVHGPPIEATGFESSQYGLPSVYTAWFVSPDGIDDSAVAPPRVWGFLPDQHIYTYAGLVWAGATTASAHQHVVHAIADQRADSQRLQWQHGARVSAAPLRLSWQTAQYRLAKSEASWQTGALRAASQTHSWQGTTPVRALFTSSWVVLVRLAGVTSSRWQGGAYTRVLFATANRAAFSARAETRTTWANTLRVFEDVSLVWQGASPPEYVTPAINVFVTGFDSSEFGDIAGYLHPEAIEPTDPQVDDKHYIAHFYQFIDVAGGGVSGFASAPPRVTLRVREVEVGPYELDLLVGRAVVYFPRPIEPFGFTSSEVGEIEEILNNYQRINTDSGVTPSSVVPDNHVVYNYVQEAVVGPYQSITDVIVPPFVYNYDQEVTVSEYLDSAAFPESIGTAEFELRDREVKPFGWVSSRYPFLTWVRNDADAALLQGFDTSLFGTADVGYRIRYVLPESAVSFPPFIYTEVANAAFQVLPATLPPASSVNIPTLVFNRNRTVAVHTPPEGEVSNFAFVDYGVRSIGPSPIDAPSNPPVQVFHDPRYILPLGLLGVVGDAQVEEFFTTIDPKTVNIHTPEWVGEPFIFNRNLTVTPVAPVLPDMGIPRVANKIQQLDFTGAEHFISGEHEIRDRRLFIKPAPVQVPVIVVTHYIFNVDPDPPATQVVYPPHASLLATGQASIVGLYGNAVLDGRTIYAESPTFNGAVGDASLRTNVIAPKSLLNYIGAGVPVVVGPQYVTAEQIPRPIPEENERYGLSDVNPTKHRVSPHTIYAPSSDQATQQADDNHKDERKDTPHKVDGKFGFLDGRWSVGGGWAWMGRPTVTHFHRVIRAPNHTFNPSQNKLSPSSVVPDSHLIENYRRVVIPEGFDSFLFMPVLIDGATRTIRLDNFGNEGGNGVLSEEFGVADVAYPEDGDRFATDVSLGVSSNYGVLNIENLHREIGPLGGVLGEIIDPPLIGYPRLFRFTGFVATIFGETTVTHYTREVPVQGFDSAYVFGYSPFEDFPFRMRVIRRDTPRGVQGFDSFTTGAHVVGSRVRYIQAWPTYDAHLGDAKTAYVVSPAGWESSVIGDIDEWEEGQLKPAGHDSSVVEIPHFASSAVMAGHQSAVVEAPRVGFGATPVGLEPTNMFGKPSLTDVTGCTVRVVPPPSVGAPDVPSPEVAHDL